MKFSVPYLLLYSSHTEGMTLNFDLIVESANIFPSFIFSLFFESEFLKSPGEAVYYSYSDRTVFSTGRSCPSAPHQQHMRSPLR